MLARTCKYDGPARARVRACSVTTYQTHIDDIVKFTLNRPVRLNTMSWCGCVRLYAMNSMHL